MTVPSAAHPHRSYKYYDLVMAGFVTVLLCSNLIGPGKVCAVNLPFQIPLIGSAVIFGAGNIFFPVSYIFGDILTEVYGYARARKVIWAGFGAMLFATVMANVVIALPPAESEWNAKYVPAVNIVFGSTWRIVTASLIAFWVGDFLNSYVLAKLKLVTSGKLLWVRTIGSTIVGQLADSAIFYPLAFASFQSMGDAIGVTLPKSLAEGQDGTSIFKIVLFNWLFKISVEAIMTPITYGIVGFLKRAENEDFYDRDTNFTPFSLED